MPVIPVIGRKTAKIRLLITVMHILLIAGCITILYPFCIMISGSVKSLVDADNLDAFPEYIYSDKTQFAKFEEARYSELKIASAAYGINFLKFDQLGLPPATKPEDIARFRQFINEKASGFPDHFYLIAESRIIQRISPRNFRQFRDDIKKECGTLEEYNRRYKGALTSWNDFPGGYDAPNIKEFFYERSDALMGRYLQFKKSVPVSDRAFTNIDGLYFVTQQTYADVKSGQIKASPILSATCPGGTDGKNWAEFVKHGLNCMYVKLDAEGMRQFRGYLAAKFPRGVGQMNKLNNTSYPSFEAVTADYDELGNSAMFTLYTDFITNVCLPERLIVDTPSTRFREYVGSSTAQAPFVAYDYEIFEQTKNSFMREMVTRNYISVVQYIAIYGRAVFNTVVFIGLSILAALLVNPLAAYALSRFNLKSTYTILMVFLGTMAFPGAVTMIPNFLLLKHFHLLNSFWALILPGVANGYSVFILKGFFDSIPKEVYESAMIDGAGEWTMFWRFTMALSTPILALMVLGAFTSAYTAFMFAMIICPDEKMWTLMVWLYQLQQGAAQPIIYAALVLASIPTLLVFVFAQNTIMKGIVIPVEK